MTLHLVRKFINYQMSSKPRVQHMSWIQCKHKDDNINRATPKVLHPPSHKKENTIAQPSTANQVGVKPIIMGGDVS